MNTVEPLNNGHARGTGRGGCEYREGRVCVQGGEGRVWVPLSEVILYRIYIYDGNF